MELKENGTEQLFSAWCLGHCCGSGIQCLFDPWIWDPGRVKNQNPDPQHWLVVRSDRYDFFKLLNSTVPYIFFYGKVPYRTVPYGKQQCCRSGIHADSYLFCSEFGSGSAYSYLK
jgi:hypothetical protein